jgi:glycosyltransferase involved in cell wall biosynthesis
MISVSIAMATYNGRNYLGRQLESLVNQPYLPTELVITDDGSNDETLLIVDDFAKSSPFPVRVYRNATRTGYRRNFMLAASLCSSDLIAFCDQDDMWYPHKLATCIECFSDPEILLVYHNADVVSNDGEHIGRLNEFAAKHAISYPMSINPMSYPLGFTQVFRRTIARLSTFWPHSLDPNHPGEPMAHDQWFFFLASVLGRIGYVKEPLAAYLQHGANTFGWNRRMHPLRRVMSACLNPADVYSHRAKSIESRAAILDRAMGELVGQWGDRAEAAAKKYRWLSQIYTARSTIYKSPGFRDRISAFREVLAGGGYHGAWTAGSRSLMKDLCLGIPIGPYLIHSTQAAIGLN